MTCPTTTPVRIKAPASKSVSHRALIAASLAQGPCLLSEVLESEDLTRTMAVMSLAGATIERLAPGRYSVAGVAGRPRGGTAEPLSVDMGESGTSCRLLTAVLAGGVGRFLVHGQGRMHERPIGELTFALAQQGPHITFQEKTGYPPFLMETGGLAGGTVNIGLSESSQYLSGLLLAAPMAAKTLAIEISGDKIVSWPYVALTLQVLEDFGLSFAVQTLDAGLWREIPWRQARDLTPGQARFVVEPGLYRTRDYAVEGDWSNASYFLAAGAIGPSPVSVTGLRRDSLQGDRAMLDILDRMGAPAVWDNGAVTIAPAPLKGLTVDMGACPDLVPTVAVLAALAHGKSVIRNVAHLRIKESDRLAAVATELARAGCRVEVLDDGLAIEPRPLKAGKSIDFLTYGDHRLAMCLSLLGLAGVDVRLDKPQCVAKSFPGFWDEWRKIPAYAAAGAQQ